MSESLARTTCTTHPDRPASARCPSCREFYCGECITEHDGKLTCASCLRGEVEEVAPERRSFSLPIAAVVQGLIALFLCWVTFYLVGQFLGDVPDDFHDGTIWE